MGFNLRSDRPKYIRKINCLYPNIQKCSKKVKIVLRWDVILYVQLMTDWATLQDHVLGEHRRIISVWHKYDAFLFNPLRTFTFIIIKPIKYAYESSFSWRTFGVLTNVLLTYLLVGEVFVCLTAWIPHSTAMNGNQQPYIITIIVPAKTTRSEKLQ